MNSKNKLIVASILVVGIILTGCSQSLVISKVDYAQPIESVLTPDEDGIVEDPQNGFSFSIMPLQYAETQDTSSVTTEQVRYIRSKEGFYYITATGYKNVYVMEPKKNSLKLENKIMISEDGITKPAFNQRETFIQLLDRDTGSAWALDPDGVRESESIASNESRR